MTHLKNDQITNGAFFALANAIRFLEDAAVLYENRRSSGSYLSTVYAREELGRFNLLWRAVEEINGGVAVTAEEVRRRLRPSQRPHHVKLQAGQSIFVSPAALPKESLIERQARFAEMRRVDAMATHERRLAEQYVDLRSDGSWSTPGQATLHEVHTFMLVVACEVGNCLMSGEGSEQFQTALTASGVLLPDSMEMQSRILSLPQFEHAGGEPDAPKF